MKIAAHIRCEDHVADIGTDHGYLPIWLAQNRAAAKIIISDINKGPLEKAEAHIERHGVPEMPELRLGGGLTVLKPGEADVIVIAGMGGILIRSILDESPEVVRQAKRLILQPRNHTFSLREYLKKLEGFSISDEEIAEEGRKLCEIITVTREDFLTEEERIRIQQTAELENELDLSGRLYDEVPAMLLVRKPKRAAVVPSGTIQTDCSAEIPAENLEFLKRKCHSEEIVIDNINENGRSAHADRRLIRAEGRLAAFQKMLHLAGKRG